MIKNHKGYLLLQVANKLIFGVSFFALASFVTLKELGEWEIFITTVYVLIPLISLQLHTAVFRFIGESLYVQTIHAIVNRSVYFLLFSVVLFLLAQHSNSILFFIPSYVAAILYGLFIIEFLKGRGELFKSSVVEFFIISLSYIAGIFSLYVDSGLPYYEVITLTAILASIIFHLYFKRTLSAGAKINIVLLKKMSIYSVALIPNALLWLLLNSGFKYIILLKTNLVHLAIFSINFRLSWALPILFSVIIVVIQNQALAVYRKNKNVEVFLLNKSVEIGVIFLLIGIVVWGGVLYAKDYYNVDNSILINVDSELLFVLLVSSILFILSSVLGLVYIVYKKTSLALSSILVSSLISILGSYLFIDSFGLYAVAYALLLGSFVNVMMRYYDLRRLSVQ
ncbi:hypothetical protein [Thiomicrorhabdus sediminis]|uniref:Membrane protein involved in the export of O-antigen and teichoic acid n=1 Tax=Thiomicrorhabdus sediminis TaxID=2580412 RepID=A0A4P9K3R7_9GAMM|nr:hypothetical protein [Thiomicrorhabdus sediminis]QCU89542.1 hypothetical protein FE785_02270 [Thiomicrorhabdus sediminis]